MADAGYSVFRMKPEPIGGLLGHMAAFSYNERLGCRDGILNLCRE